MLNHDLGKDLCGKSQPATMNFNPTPTITTNKPTPDPEFQSNNDHHTLQANCTKCYIIILIIGTENLGAKSWIIQSNTYCTFTTTITIRMYNTGVLYDSTNMHSK